MDGGKEEVTGYGRQVHGEGEERAAGWNIASDSSIGQ